MIRMERAVKAARRAGAVLWPLSLHLVHNSVVCVLVSAGVES